VPYEWVVCDDIAGFDGHGLNGFQQGHVQWREICASGLTRVCDKVSGAALTEKMCFGSKMQASVVFRGGRKGNPERNAVGLIQWPVAEVLVPSDGGGRTCGLIDHIVLKEEDLLGLEKLTGDPSEVPFKQHPSKAGELVPNVVAQYAVIIGFGGIANVGTKLLKQLRRGLGMHTLVQVNHAVLLKVCVGVKVYDFHRLCGCFFGKIRVD
jgi:hypothetical protein